MTGMRQRPGREAQVQVNDGPDAAGGLPLENPLAMAGLQLHSGTGMAEIAGLVLDAAVPALAAHSNPVRATACRPYATAT